MKTTTMSLTPEDLASNRGLLDDHTESKLRPMMYEVVDTAIEMKVRPLVNEAIENAIDELSLQIGAGFNEVTERFEATIYKSAG